MYKNQAYPPRLRLCLNLSHATALSGTICSQSRTRSRSCVRVGLSCHFPSVFDPRYYLKRCDKIWWFCATCWPPQRFSLCVCGYVCIYIYTDFFFLVVGWKVLEQTWISKHPSVFPPTVHLVWVRWLQPLHVENPKGSRSRWVIESVCTDCIFMWIYAHV